ncbi:MAG: DedA family protein [Vulcanimicrobiaceae bacterium]
METVQALVLALVHDYGYAGLFVVMILGNLAMPVGTEVVVPIAGAAAGAGHLSSWVLVGAVATLGEVVGGSALYALGYYAGEPVVHRFGRRAEHELQRVQAYYERHGRKTVFLCRFIPFVRGIASLPPGISRMPKRYFLTYHTLGSAIFCFGLAFLGFSLGKNFTTMLPVVRRFSLILILVAVAAIAALLWTRRRNNAAASL